VKVSHIRSRNNSGYLEGIPLVAHRGYAARYPENSRESLAAAVAAGARFLEFDVQLSADGIPVLLHDATLDRTAGRAGSVFDLSAAELSRIEVNESERLNNSFHGVTIPLLKQVAEDLSGWPGVTAFVEIKEESLDRFGISFMVKRVLDALGQVVDSCVVISFSEEAALQARQQCGCAIGWAVRRWSEESRRIAGRLAPEYLFCNHRKFPPPPEPLWQGPWRWVAYEVTQPSLAFSLARRGVHMIETMAIAEMLAQQAPTAGSGPADGNA